MKWIDLSLDNYQQKSFAESMKISSGKFSSTFATNKSSYAYDNLAYGFSHDVKRTSENWNQMKNILSVNFKVNGPCIEIRWFPF